MTTHTTGKCCDECAGLIEGCTDVRCPCHTIYPGEHDDHCHCTCHREKGEDLRSTPQRLSDQENERIAQTDREMAEIRSLAGPSQSEWEREFEKIKEGRRNSRYHKNYIATHIVEDFIRRLLTSERAKWAELLKTEIDFIEEGIQACKDDSAKEDCVGDEVHYIFGKSQALKIMKFRLDAILAIIRKDK